jgi:hypothetical protein
MKRLCRWTITALALLYAVALLLWLVGRYGLFGAERDPLSAVFLVPLGWPWVLWLDGIAEPWRPWIAAATPLINLVLLALLCRLVRRDTST